MEAIALHVAQSFGGAQFYISCGQVNVVNGGSGTPGPLVSIPGVYTGYVCLFMRCPIIGILYLITAPHRNPVFLSTLTTLSPRTTPSPVPPSGLGEKPRSSFRSSCIDYCQCISFQDTHFQSACLSHVRVISCKLRSQNIPILGPNAPVLERATMAFS